MQTINSGSPLSGDARVVAFLPRISYLSEVRTACGSGRLILITDVDSIQEINRPLPQAVLTCTSLLALRRLTGITTLGERGRLFPVALSNGVKDRLDLKRRQIRIRLHYQSDDPDNVRARKTVAR
jgi:hypothetical protein